MGRFKKYRPGGEWIAEGRRRRRQPQKAAAALSVAMTTAVTCGFKASSSQGKTEDPLPTVLGTWSSQEPGSQIQHFPDAVGNSGLASGSGAVSESTGILASDIPEHSLPLIGSSMNY